MSAPRRFAFVAIQATGPDLAADRAYRFQARLPDGSGRSHGADWFADPGTPALRARAARILPQGAPVLDGLAPQEAVFSALDELVAGRVVVGYERDSLLRWWRTLRIAEAKLRHDSQAIDTPDPVIVGVADLARLVLPGRRSSEREALLRLAFDPGSLPESDLTAAELERLLGGVCRTFLSRSTRDLEIASSFLAFVVSQLRSNDPASARVLEAGLDLLDRPSAWRTKDASLFPQAAELVDEVLSSHVKSIGEAVHAFEEAEPRFTLDLDARFHGSPLADVTAAPVPLDAQDREAIRVVFEESLPRVMGAPPRPQQAALATVAANALADSQVCLVDAPTGTGKTMAYLVPALLWSVKSKTRVGVSTYTIALQEQVFDRELPRAFELLAATGALDRLGEKPRVTILKGKERYLCARNLRASMPDPLDPPEIWLAWTILVLFALDDPDGDLDRVSRRIPLWLERKGPAETAFLAMLREARSRVKCCDTRQDRFQCGAWVARRRAERCHVVVTNHAFVLRDPLFLRNLIADECDHLHPVARGAASAEVSFRTVRETLTGFASPPPANLRGGLRAPRDVLSRVERGLAQRNLFESHALGRSCATARVSSSAAVSALEDLETVARTYLDTVKAHGAAAGDPSLEFQHFAESSDQAARLREARVRLTRSLSELAGLAEEIAGSLDTGIVDDAGRLRARIHQASLDFAELALDLQDWLPIAEETMRFDPTCFYDVEWEGVKHPSIVAKRNILLPNRWLAERYYPSMQSLLLISATTWLDGSFELAEGYLGLDMLRAGTEDRDPRPVQTHRSPPAFDYSRMLLTIPNDVPEASFAHAAGRQAFDRYLTQFVLGFAQPHRGGTLVLLTNLQQCRNLGRELQGEFRERGIPFFWQGMDGFVKEELPRAFRSSPGAVLMGVDTFWYGVDFPGELLETVVVGKLPFGAPDRYTRAQERALGRESFQKTLYIPEALTMFRQGVGRLLRRETDWGAVHVLDPRVMGRWKRFLRELPGLDPILTEDCRMRVVVAETAECLRDAESHAEKFRGAATPVRRTRQATEP